MGALVAWTAALVIASATANAVARGGGDEQLLPYFATMLAMTALGGTIGCWAALAVVGERWAARTGVAVLILLPVLLVGLELGAAFLDDSGNGLVAMGVIALSAILATLAARRLSLSGRARHARI